MDHAAAIRITNPLAECFQHGVVRFLAAETLDALPANYAQIRAAGSRLMKRINEGCLSDPRLSSDEDHLPLSFQGLAEIAVQLGHSGFATDHLPRGVNARLCGRPCANGAHR